MSCWDEIRRQREEHERLKAALPSRWTLVDPTGDGRFRVRALRRGRSASDAERHVFVHGRTADEVLDAIAEADGRARR